MKATDYGRILLACQHDPEFHAGFVAHGGGFKPCPPDSKWWTLSEADYRDYCMAGKPDQKHHTNRLVTVRRHSMDKLVRYWVAFHADEPPESPAAKQRWARIEAGEERPWSRSWWYHPESDSVVSVDDPFDWFQTVSNLVPTTQCDPITVAQARNLVAEGASIAKELLSLLTVTPDEFERDVDELCGYDELGLDGDDDDDLGLDDEEDLGL